MASIPAAVGFDAVWVTTTPTDGSGSPLTILRQIQGEIPEGNIVTVVGPSGAGKSTLLSLMNLLRTPTRGQVRVQGREVRRWPVAELRRTVGMVFQQPVMLPGTVAENLTVGPKLRGTTLVDGEGLLHMVGLAPEFLRQPAEALSGGQKQRVALARVLANQPQILLLDEVTSALDPVSSQGIEDLVVQLNRSLGVTIVWVTHHLQQAQRVGDWTWFLQNGELVEVAPTQQFFATPASEAARQFTATERSAPIRKRFVVRKRGKP